MEGNDCWRVEEEEDADEDIDVMMSTITLGNAVPVGFHRWLYFVTVNKKFR